MPSIVFVHGVGVRDGGYPNVWPHLQERLEKSFPDAPAQFCYWGGDHGAQQRADAPTEALPDPQVQRWAASLADPWWELEALAEKASQERPALRPPNLPRPGPILRNRLTALADEPELGAPSFHKHLPDAVNRLLRTPVVVRCLSRAEAIEAELPPALARALVVLTLEDAGGQEVAVLAPGDLDRFEAELITALGGQAMGALSSIRALAYRLIRPHLMAALMPVSQGIALARGPLERKLTAYLGDVMVYLARGTDIRAAIADRIESQGGPVDVIAHSLGGIACFDLLVAGRLRNVRTLVTAGTQIGYLYGIDALPGLTRGLAPPALPEWVNVYDRHDVLSFPVSETFPGAVRDERLDSGLPFPFAHSAYFRNDRFYDLLTEVIR